MKFYHLASIPLGEGSIIELGNWGRIELLNKIGKRQCEQDAERREGVLLELAYEQGRLIHSPDAPSRMSCLFACPDILTANAFKNSTRRDKDILYEVELVDKSVPCHWTKWELFSLKSVDDFYSLQEKIKAYWGKNIDDCTEVLIGGAVRILRKVPLPQQERNDAITVLPERNNPFHYSPMTSQL